MYQVLQSCKHYLCAMWWCFSSPEEVADDLSVWGARVGQDSQQTWSEENYALLVC